MHEAAEDKQKFYTCIVWLSRPFKDFETDVAAKLQPLKDLTIQQRQAPIAHSLSTPSPSFTLTCVMCAGRPCACCTAGRPSCVRG